MNITRDTDPQTGPKGERQPRRDRLRAELQDLPLWAGLLLTGADMVDRPGISLATWGVVVIRALVRTLHGRH